MRGLGREKCVKTITRPDSIQGLAPVSLPLCAVFHEINSRTPPVESAIGPGVSFLELPVHLQGVECMLPDVEP